MTLITFEDGKVVMRDGSVGTGPECCCQQGGGGGDDCVCGENCEQEISIDFVKGDLSGNVTTAPGDFGSANIFSDTQFALITVTSSCGPFGPGGECGWLIEILVCGCVDDPGFPFNCDPFSSAWAAFVPYDENGCPEVGELTIVCVGGDCEGTLTGSVT